MSVCVGDMGVVVVVGVHSCVFVCVCVCVCVDVRVYGGRPGERDLAGQRESLPELAVDADDGGHS